MVRVIITAEVADSANWRSSFRTHLDVFKAYTATAVHFGTTGDNAVATYWEVDDLGAFTEHVESPATAEAMASDGIKRDTVKIFVLDGEIDL